VKLPPLTEIAQQRTVRLIPTAHWKPPVLRALVDDDDELAIIEALEARTSRRLTRPVVQADLDRWGHTHIAAAFAYTRKGGNRFNDEARGAWYAGFDDRTALAEVGFHRTRELGFIGEYRDEVQYRALHASFIGRFHDLRSAQPVPEALHADPAIGYPAGQALARALIGDGSRGLIYPSVRHQGGTCIAAFQPNVVQDVAPGACWLLRWAGTPAWTATAV
jgi:hypothetical protein